jgi:Lon protease-like protein
MLVTSLAMGCPFDPSEKQALLEAKALPARAEVLTSLLEMSGGLPDTSEGTRH